MNFRRSRNAITTNEKVKKHSKDQIASGVFSPKDESGDSKIFKEQLMEFCMGMGGTFSPELQLNVIKHPGPELNG